MSKQTPKPETATVEPTVKAGTYEVQDGDTYPAIATALKPAGKTVHEYSTELYEKNNGKNLTPGDTIEL